MKRLYFHKGRLDLELGGHLDRPAIAYHTYGHLNENRDNVVWVCHALTADSDVAGWWPHTVEKGAFLDPDKWFVVCANILGSHYGTTGPLSPDPATGRSYYTDFPALTIGDMASGASTRLWEAQSEDSRLSNGWRASRSASGS